MTIVYYHHFPVFFCNLHTWVC